MAPFISWFFGALIYFKVAIDASLRGDVSVVAAVLLAGMVAATAFFSAKLYAVINEKYQAQLITEKATSTFYHAARVFLSSLAINIILGKLIIFGFSKKLNRELDGDILYEFSGYRSDETFILMAILTVPLVFHFAFILYTIKMTERNRPI